MRVDIDEVKDCRNKALGNCIFRSRNYARITISRKRNTNKNEYAATVLHELLHLWIRFLKFHGFRCRNAREHRFINVVEQVVVYMAVKFLARKRRKK